MLTNFKKKQKAGRSKSIMLVFGGFLILLVSGFLIVANYRIYQGKQKLNSQIESLQNQIQGIKNSNNTLQEGISKSSDSAYIEKVAREELDLQKPGEKIVSFIMPPASPQKTIQENKTFFQNWSAWVGNIGSWIKSGF